MGTCVNWGIATAPCKFPSRMWLRLCTHTSTNLAHTELSIQSASLQSRRDCHTTACHHQAVVASEAILTIPGRSQHRGSPRSITSIMPSGHLPRHLPAGGQRGIRLLLSSHQTVQIGLLMVFSVLVVFYTRAKSIEGIIMPLLLNIFLSTLSFENYSGMPF